MASESLKKTVNFTEDTMDQVRDTPAEKTECEHHIPVRNFTFLRLAPETSPSYETHRRRSSSISSAKIQAAPADDFVPAELASPPIDRADTTADEIEYMLRTRRSSSISSAQSFGLPRVLKLSPVFGGGVPGEQDFILKE